MAEPLMLVIDAHSAWVYHVIGARGKPIYRRERHGLVLDPQKRWCITHWPAVTCQCGQYALDWQ